MKNLLVLLLLIVGVGALIWWLWSGKSTPEDQSVNATSAASEAAERKPVSPSKSAQTDFKIVIDDQNRLVLEKLNGVDVNIIVTENETKDAAVMDGLLTYSEKVNGAWSFRALSLDEYIARYME